MLRLILFLSLILLFFHNEGHVSTVLLSQYKVQILKKKGSEDPRCLDSCRVKILEIISGDSLYKKNDEIDVSFTAQEPVAAGKIICLELADGGGLDEKGKPWSSNLWTLIKCP